MQRRLFLAGRALILSVLLSLLAMLLTQPTVASAHAYVIGSDPMDGSTVASVPRAVHIYFNAAISPLSSAQVIYAFEDGSGRTLDVGASPSFVAANGRELVIPLKNPAALSQGNYLVSWTAIANGDGHITYGNIGFNIGYSSLPLTGTAILGPSTSNDVDDVQTLTLASLFAILGEWLALAALSIWIGILGIEQFILQLTPRPTLRERAHSLQRRCLMVLLFGTVIDFIAHAIHLSQSGIDFPLFSAITQSDFGYSHLPLPLVAWKLITQTNYGIISLLCIILIIIALILQLRTTGRTRNCLLAVLIALMFVITSSDAQVLQPSSVAIVLAWLKLIAQGLWLGGLTALLMIPGIKDGDDQEMLLSWQQRFVPMIGISMAITVITLLMLGIMSIHNPQQLFHDPYGITLTIQIILTITAMLLTICLKHRVSRAKGEATLRAIHCAYPIGTRTRASAQFIALFCTALMSFYAPPIVFPNINYTSQPDRAINRQTKQIGPFSVTVNLSPGQVGTTNTVTISINDNTGKAIADAQVGVTINMQTMNMGTTHILLTSGNPSYSATFNARQAFSMSGPWLITLAIQSSGQQTVQGTFDMAISG